MHKAYFVFVLFWFLALSGQSWWRHQMETFSALLAICAGNSPAPGEFPAQRPVTRSFHVFFYLRSNNRLSKQWRGWWFEKQSSPLWRHRNDWMWSSQGVVIGEKVVIMPSPCFQWPLLKHAMLYDLSYVMIANRYCAKFHKYSKTHRIRNWLIVTAKKVNRTLQIGMQPCKKSQL